MGLNAPEGAYEGNNSSGTDGYGGWSGSGYAGETTGKKGFWAGFWDFASKAVAYVAKAAIHSNPITGLVYDLAEETGLLEKAKSGNADDETGASTSTTTTEPDNNGKEADPGANIGGTVRGNEPVKPVKPAPKIIRPLPPATPAFSTDLFPAQMGTATVKKKKLLGGDILKRV